MINNRPRVLVLLLLLSALLFVWWPQPARISAKPPEEVFLPEASTQLRTEEHRIVADIGSGIAELVAFAATRQTPALARIQFNSGPGPRPGEYRFEMRLGGSHSAPVQTRLVLANHLWSPENFAPLARQLMGEWRPGLTGTRSPVDLEMFVRLTTPTPDTLVREDKRLSEALTQFPHDAELQEEAALLIGSFALRHAAGSFYDVRRELSRLTAHLAIARALSDERGPAGDLAEAILNTLVGRQSAALEILPRLEHNAGTGAGVPLAANTIWTKALTLRNAGDYRKLDQPEHASLLERLEYVRALHSRIDSTTASAFLRAVRAEKLAEWSEIVLSGAYSVSEGHTWAERAVEWEIDEIATAYRQYHGKRLEDSEWSAALNTTAEHIRQEGQEQAHLDVIGWGSWAELHQRQLCQVIRTTWDWLDDKLGAPDGAKTFWKSMDERFSQLRLLPLVELEHDGNAEGHRAFQDRARTLAQAHPDWVPFALWPDFLPQPNEGRQQHVRTQQPLMKWSWFRSAISHGVLPYGTLYDYVAREKSSLNSLPAEELEKLKAIAPYNRLVLHCQLQRAKQYRPTPDDYEAQFATLANYDLWSMKIVSNALKADPDRFERAFLPICHISPDHFIELGNYLVAHDRPEAAVRAYQNAIDQAPDRVYLSNNVCWLAKHYYKEGRRKEAFEVAKMAADVYSSGGLRTMGTLLEGDGQLRHAEEYFNKIAQRYGHWGDLVHFYGCHRRDEAQFDAAFQRLIGKIFPQGQESVDIATLSGAPTDGVMLTGMSNVTSGAGMKVGDTIIAINGVRVRNSEQYFYLMDSAASPRTELGLWSGREYRSVVLDLPEHRIGGAIVDRHQ